MPKNNRWKLEDAKARFSELVRQAKSDGPQHVSVRGRDAVVVISAQEFDRLVPRKPQQGFIQFMKGLHLAGLDLTRDEDHGRDADL